MTCSVWQQEYFMETERVMRSRVRKSTMALAGIFCTRLPQPDNAFMKNINKT
ncbi:MAG TPA: hypothetical protein VJK52_00915 [Candidatus Nanoarchaeia archaeon]|nr:hypothetical protein [Candidatus Nanoarchaeia archaeon]